MLKKHSAYATCSLSTKAQAISIQPVFSCPPVKYISYYIIYAEKDANATHSASAECSLSTNEGTSN